MFLKLLAEPCHAHACFSYAVPCGVQYGNQYQPTWVPGPTSRSAPPTEPGGVRSIGAPPSSGHSIGCERDPYCASGSVAEPPATSPSTAFRTDESAPTGCRTEQLHVEPISGGGDTVSSADPLVTEPQAFVTTTSYAPSSAGDTPSRTSRGDEDPDANPPPGRVPSLSGRPSFRHWYEKGAPPATDTAN